MFIYAPNSSDQDLELLAEDIQNISKKPIIIGNPEQYSVSGKDNYLTNKFPGEEPFLQYRKSAMGVYEYTIENTNSVQDLINNAQYRQNRAKLFNLPSVEYLGETKETPRAIILLPYTENRMERIAKIISAIPDGWHNKISFVSTKNVDNLGKMLDNLSETIFLCLDTASASKLKYLGIDHVMFHEPKEFNDKRYGIDLREKISLLSSPMI